MKKKKIIIFFLMMTMLCACGKKEEKNDIDVNIATSDSVDQVELSRVEKKGTYRDAVGTESHSNKNSENGLDAEKDKELQAYGEAIIQDNGMVAVTPENNVLASEKEKEDKALYNVKLADIEGYKAERKKDGWMDGKTEDEWLSVMLKGYMGNSVLPVGMPLRKNDRVSMKILSSGGIASYEDIIGTEVEMIVGSGDVTPEAEKVFSTACVGDMVEIPVKDSKTEEEKMAKVQIVSAVGNREMEDLSEEWLKENYPEYDSVNSFLDEIKKKRRKNAEVLSEDAELSLFLDYLGKNSTVEGVDSGTHLALILIESAYLATHGNQATEEKYELYLSDIKEDDSGEAKKMYVEGLLKKAMYEDLGGDENWVTE